MEINELKRMILEDHLNSPIVDKACMQRLRRRLEKWKEELDNPMEHHTLMALMLFFEDILGENE